MTEFSPKTVRPIFGAISAGDVEAVRKYLTDRLELREYSSITTPSWLKPAANSGNLEMVKLILSLGMDINKADKDGWSALCSAIMENHVHVVRYLLSQGADA